MPSRGVIGAILLAWLGTTGWLFWHDLWPYWQPGQPPPFDIDIVDEVQRDQSPTFWEIHCEGPQGERPRKDQYQALTHVEYRHRTNLFVLCCELQVRPSLLAEDRPRGVVRPNPVGANGINNYIVTTCSINRAGQLRAFTVQVTGRIDPTEPARIPPLDSGFAALFPSLPSRQQQPFILDLSGEVHQEQLLIHAQASLVKDPPEDHRPVLPPPPVVLEQIAGDDPPLAVSHFGTILMPLHPLHRIASLRRGQHWSVPMIHPLQAALQALDPKTTVRPEMVEVQVRPTLDAILWDKGKDKDKEERACLVIDYQGKDVSGSTWVEQDSGRVLRHRMTLWDQTWTFERRPAVAINPSYST